MSGVKISALPAASAANGTDQLEVNQGGTSKRITVDQLNTVTGAGTVSSVSVASANGLAGAVATPTTTPAITLSTTVTGITKGNGTALSAAVAGTDYMTPANVSSAYLPLAGGTLTGPLTGTTATFSSTVGVGGSVGSAKFRSTAADGDLVGLFSGATKGLRIIASATTTSIEGVDSTGTGSFQPLALSGSVVIVSPPLAASSTITALAGTAVGAGAATQAFVKASSTANLGIYYGTGDPTFSAAKGSLYSKTDATTTTTRLWVNTNGSTTWTNLTTAA